MEKISMLKNYPQLQGQRSAVLVGVKQRAAKIIGENLRTILTGEIPPGNRSVLLLYFIGNEDIPFVHCVNFGTPRQTKYESLIGQVFKIEIEEEKKQEPLPLFEEQNA